MTKHSRPSMLSSLREHASQAAQDAGRLIVSHSRQDAVIAGLKLAGDVVTTADLASEQLIVGRIRSRFPEHRIYSEECGQIEGDERWTWVIDPLDGTNNFRLGIPVSAVGITIFEDEVPVVAVVHDPWTRQTWSAVQGQGTTGRGVRAASLVSMRDRSRILAWTQGYAVSKQSSEAWAQRMILARHNLRVLELWAPLPCWILLIQGKIDALVGYQVGKVDLLGGVLLARESGFEVRNPDGSPFPTIAELDSLAVEDQSFVAGPAAIVDLLLEQMNEAESVASMITAGLGTPLESAERSTA